MSRASGYRPIVWLRRLLLVALVAFLGIVTGLLVKGGRGGPGTPEVSPEVAELRSGEAGQLRTGKGFGHEVTEAGKTRYRIGATSWSSTRDELVRLEGVEVTVARDDGNNYTIKADSGVYQENTATAGLVGNVSIRSSDGIEMAGPGFELTRQGQLIVSTDGPVRFRYQDRFAGRAHKVTANLARKRSELSGSVRIWSLDSTAMDGSLMARRLVFEEKAQQVHAEGGVILRGQGQQLNARRLSVTLDEAGKQPQFVRAKWEVSGSRGAADEGLPQTLEFSAAELSLIFDPAAGSLRKAELEGDDRAPVEFRAIDAGGAVRQLSAPYLIAEFTAGDLASAEAVGPVELRDFLAIDPVPPHRISCADSAAARFRRGGELAALTLDGKVQLNQPEAQVSGDRLEAQADGQIVVSGEPAQIHARRGDFEAPQILYRSEKGSGKASGGVRADLAGGSGFGLMTSGAETREPMRVTAELAEWSDDGGEVVFRQTVRAWQAENFLVANTMRIGQTGKSLIAEGQVKTVIKKTREPDAANAEPASREPRPPLEVTAAKLEYDGASGTLHYTGAPKAYQAGRSLRCEDLGITLDEESEVEQMLCTGNTVIENPQSGQTVRGSEALYRPGDESVLVTGSPVVLRNANGTEVSGARVVYDLETGTARVLTREPAPPAGAPVPDGDPGIGEEQRDGS